MWPSRLLVLLLAAALGGCAARAGPPVGAVPLRSTINEMGGTYVPPPVGPPPPVVAVPPPAPAAVAPPEPLRYPLDSGDKLRIIVFGQEGLTNSYAVDADGNISMPLIGAVAARGLSKEELSRRIADRFLKKNFIREPHVAIEIETYRPFFILGEVTLPGQYAYVANMTVETAIAIAGGFAPRAFKGPVEIRRNANGEAIRLIALPDEFVRPGDTITIAERWF